eukprot:1203228-Amphidinium_carterae.2
MDPSCCNLGHGVDGEQKEGSAISLTCPPQKRGSTRSQHEPIVGLGGEAKATDAEKADVDAQQKAKAKEALKQ